VNTSVCEMSAHRNKTHHNAFLGHLVKIDRI